MGLKNTIGQFGDSRNRFYALASRVFKPFRNIIRLIKEPRLRAELLNSLRKHQFQDSVFTKPYRYPRLFEQCSIYFQAHPAPAILSFGCSTGEEVFSLSDYLPQAIITGIDINSWCIKECNRKNKSDRISFGLRHSKKFDSLSGLDAIFCMAVFQRTENKKKTTQRTTKITFGQFEKELAILDQKLGVGGLFFIDVCDFDLADTLLYSARYRPLEFEANRLPKALPVFNRQNERVAETRNFYRVFVKQL